MGMQKGAKNQYPTGFPSSKESREISMKNLFMRIGGWADETVVNEAV